MRIPAHVSAAISAALLLGGCGLPVSVRPTPAHPAPTESASATGVFQDLTFTGKLPARWTTADVTCGNADGAGAESFSVKLTGEDANGQKVTLTVVIPSGYRGAGEYSIETTTSLRVAGTNGTLVARSTPQLPTRFLVRADLKSGLIDSTMAQGSDLQDATERVVGSWRCK